MESSSEPAAAPEHSRQGLDYTTYLADYRELPQGIPRKIAFEHLQTLEDVESFRKVCSLWKSEASDIDYGELPRGIPRKIAVEHLESIEDVENFKEVCSLWRSDTSDVNYANFSPSSNTQFPWLMLVDSPTSSYRRFYSLSKRMFRKIDLPKELYDDGDERRYLSSKGWLIGVSRTHGLITFFDPFGGTVITPPSVPVHEFIDPDDEWDEVSFYYQVSKFIFSSDSRNRKSSSGGDDDMQVEVAMIFDKIKQIAFWRPGQPQWITPVVKNFKVRQVEDVCFFNGVFYTIDHDLQVIAVENPNPPRIVVDLLALFQDLQRATKYYIVPLGEQQPASLLVVCKQLKYEDGDDSELYWTGSLVLFEVNVENKTARRVSNIGNRALFIGHNSTFFVDASASPSHGCRPNCIYFTDDNTEMYEVNNSSRGGGADMGIYSLDENKVVDRVLYEGPSQYSYETPPLWVERRHH